MLPCFWDNGSLTRNRPQTRSTPKLLPGNHLDRIRVAFDDHRLASNAGLLVPATLTLHLSLPQLVQKHLTWDVPQAEPTPAIR